MVETVGDVEREFVINALMLRSHLNSTVDIHDQIAAPRNFFPGNRVVAEADYIGRAALSEILLIGLRHALIVNENNAHFAPSVGRGDRLQLSPQPISQLFEILDAYRMVLLLV